MGTLTRNGWRNHSFACKLSLFEISIYFKIKSTWKIFMSYLLGAFRFYATSFTTPNTNLNISESKINGKENTGETRTLNKVCFPTDDQNSFYGVEDRHKHRIFIYWSFCCYYKNLDDWTEILVYLSDCCWQYLVLFWVILVYWVIVTLVGNRKYFRSLIINYGMCITQF